MINYILDDKQNIKLLNKEEDIIFSNYLTFVLEVTGSKDKGIFNKLIFTDQFKKDIDKSMELLSKRTQKILRLRYGLDDGIKHTRSEIGEVFNITGPRVRTLEMSGIRNIKYCNGIKYIEKYTTIYRNVDNSLYKELLIRELENYLFDDKEGIVNKFLNNLGIKMIVKKSPFFIQNKKKGLQLEDKPLEELDLDLRLTMCLQRAGYTSLLEILPLKEDHDELMRIRNIGIMAAKRLTEWLDDYETKMLDLYSDAETISISLISATNTEHFNFFNINTYKIAAVIIDYLKEKNDLILDEDIDEITKVIAFKKGYITKELFAKNLECIKREKTHYLYYHPLQEKEKMIESYILFGKCTYKDNDEKTISSLNNAFIVTECSILNYYEDAERFIDYNHRTSFNSVSKFILEKDIC